MSKNKNKKKGQIIERINWDNLRKEKDLLFIILDIEVRFVVVLKNEAEDLGVSLEIKDRSGNSAYL